jgi:hypothetical protein
MPVDRNDTENGLAPVAQDRSTVRGDVPESLRRRYFTEERPGDGLGFYADARINTPAFRDRGRELVAARPDPNAIRDMALIAQHRGWRSVVVRGSEDFRRDAWLTGRAMGLDVRGYRATDRDLQELERRQASAQRADDRREIRHERREERRHHAEDGREAGRERRDDAAADRRLRIVEAVVRDRIADPQRQSQIMAAARTRIADWLDRGAQFDELAQPRGRQVERQRVR